MNKLRCTGKEGFQRMNYLYQISNFLATQSVAGNVASSLNSNLMVNISRKTVQRMEIDMKRTICKVCRSLLLAGITCKMRIEKKTLIYTCLKCGNKKRLNLQNKTFLPWTQQDESMVEVIDFGRSEKIKGEKNTAEDTNNGKNTVPKEPNNECKLRE